MESAGVKRKRKERDQCHAVVKFLKTQLKEKAQELQTLERDLYNLEDMHRLARWTEQRKHASVPELWAMRKRKKLVLSGPHEDGIYDVTFQGSLWGHVEDSGFVTCFFGRTFHLREQAPDGKMW